MKITRNTPLPAPPPPTTFTIEADEAEAQLLINLVAKIGGSGPVRMVTEALYRQLRDVGLEYKDVDIWDLSSLATGRTSPYLKDKE